MANLAVISIQSKKHPEGARRSGPSRACRGPRQRCREGTCVVCVESTDGLSDLDHVEGREKSGSWAAVQTGGHHVATAFMVHGMTSRVR